MRRLGQSQTVCLINFDHVALICGATLGSQLSSSRLQKLRKFGYRTKLILTSETRLFQQQDLFTWEHTGE